MHPCVALMEKEKRSYREENISWGITTALQMLLYQQHFGKPSISFEDVWDVARIFAVTDDLYKRTEYLRSEESREING